MSEQDLRGIIRSPASDFVPVRIYLSNGTQFDILHSEAIMIGRTSSAILVDGQISLIGNMHVNRVEPLATAAS